MITLMHSDFLNDETEYRRAETYWNQLWTRIDPLPKRAFGWVTPWVGTGSPSLLDGNPIFSAYSLRLRKGIRIIQHAPTEDQLELAFWLDTFGGPVTDPESIRELVIACALSDVAAIEANSLMSRWVEAEASSITLNKPATHGALLPLRDQKKPRSYTILPAA